MLFPLNLSAIPFKILPKLCLTILLGFDSSQVTFCWNHIDKPFSPSLSQARGKPFHFCLMEPSHLPLLPRKYTSISVSIYLNKPAAIWGARCLVISLNPCLPNNHTAKRLLIQSLYLSWRFPSSILASFVWKETVIRKPPSPSERNDLFYHLRNAKPDNCWISNQEIRKNFGIQYENKILNLKLFLLSKSND